MKSKKLTSFWINLDIFGIKTHLYYKGKPHDATKFGVFLTFLLFFFTILCFFYFGQDIYLKQNPALIYNEEYEGLPEKYILDPELMPLLIEINSAYGKEFYTDPSMIKVKIGQYTYNKTVIENSITLIEYDMEICRPDHFDHTDEITKEHFLKMKLNDFFCIPKFLKNLTLQGAFDQQIYQSIMISFNICDNKTNNNRCQNINTIKERMNKGFMGFYFKDLTINPGSYDIESVKKSSPRQIFTNFDLKTQKEINVFFKNNYIVTDDGILTETLDEKKVVNFDNYLEFTTNEENNQFLSLFLRLSQKKTQYKRRYPKVQNLIAMVGGFINCFWILATAINFFHAHLIFIRDIVLDIFTIKFIKIDTVEIKKAKITKIKQKDKESTDSEYGDKDKGPNRIIIKKENLFNSSNSNDQRNQKLISLKGNEKKIPVKEKNNKKNITRLKFGFIDFINYYFGIFKTPERDQKKAILKKGMNIFRKNLDANFLIKKFYEIEKLKLLLLNETELKVFDQLPKPQLELIVTNNSFAVETKLMTRKLSQKIEKRN